MHKPLHLAVIVLGLFLSSMTTIILPISYGQSLGSSDEFSRNGFLGNNVGSFGDNSGAKNDQTKLIDFTVNETSGLKTHINPFHA